MLARCNYLVGEVCYSSRVRTLLVLALLAVAATARADEVMPPPDRCPSGCEGITSHSGPQCVRPTCHTDADCDHGTHCALRCIQWSTYGAAGLIDGPPKPEPPGPDTPYAIDHGPCGHGETCPPGAQCADTARCDEIAGHPCYGDPDAPMPGDPATTTPATPATPATMPSATTTTTASSGGGCCAHESAAQRSASVLVALGGLGLAVVLSRSRRR